MQDFSYYFNLIGHALRLEPDIFQAIQFSPHNLRFSVVTILCAGLSVQLGQSVILLANRVKPPRFLLSILLGSFFYFLNVFVWSISIWVLGKTFFNAEVSFIQVINVMGIAQSPYLFGFLVFVPFLGIPISWVLSLYSLLAVVTGLEVVFNVSAPMALIASGIGWLVLQLFQRTVGQPITQLAQYVRTRVAGLEELRQHIDAYHLIEHVESRLERETETFI
jgi:hypothetical protein